MATFLSYKELSSLPQASKSLSRLVFENPLRPAVLTALNLLGEVGQEITSYKDSPNQTSQLAALARAMHILQQLRQYVNTEVAIPDRFLCL